MPCFLHRRTTRCWAPLLRIVAAMALVVLQYFAATNAVAQTQSDPGFIAPPAEMSLSPGGVELQSGGFVYTSAGVKIGEGEENLSSGYTYMGSTQHAGVIGIKWTHANEIYLHLTPTNLSGSNGNQYTATIVIGKERHVFNSPIVIAGPYSPDNDNDNGYALNYNSANPSFSFKNKMGVLYNFSNFQSPAIDIWLVTNIMYPDGYTESFNYTFNSYVNGGGILKSIRDNRGRGLNFEYNANGYLSGVCALNLSSAYVDPLGTCPAGAPKDVLQYASYTYSVNGTPTSFFELSSITNPILSTTNITYSSTRAHYITCVQNQASPSCQISLSYDGMPHYSTCVNDPVTSQGGLNAVSYTYVYGACNGLIGPDNNMNSSTQMTYGSSSVENYTFSNAFGPILSRQDANGNTTTFSRNFILIQKITYPQGNYSIFTYDSRSNIIQKTDTPKPGSTLAAITVQRTYPVSCTNPIICNRPTQIIDALGKITDLAYDPGHGGTLSVMGPAPTAGGARPLTLTSWTQRYAWIMNQAGTMVQATSPIWVKSSETTCQTTAGAPSNPVCDTNAPVVTTTFEYGANGTKDALLVKGLVRSGGGVTLRSCISYDLYERKLSETLPNANLTVCP